MRLIDADALLQAIPDPLERDEKISRNAAIRDMMELVLDAPTVAPAPRWIPVEERLPEKDGYVLALKMPCPLPEILYYTNGAFEVGRSRFVSHWMPLPEPPEAKG